MTEKERKVLYQTQLTSNPRCVLTANTSISTYNKKGQPIPCGRCDYGGQTFA